MKTQTKIIHTKGSPDKSTGSIIPPIHLSSVFAMDEPSSHSGFQYGRVGNPTREILEDTLAELHKAKFAKVFSSGSASVFTVLCLLKKDDHIVCHAEVYEGTQRIITKIFHKFGIKATFVNFNNKIEFSSSFRKNTKLVFAESPTNPFLSTIDIMAISTIAHTNNALFVVDNTFATPILQQPLKHGADIVVESLTKAINGHTDTLGGAILTNNKNIAKRITFLHNTLGSTLSPFDSFLIMRGLKTLSLRIDKQQKNTLRIFTFLKSQKNIQTIFFPKKSKQLMGRGFIISFVINGTKLQGEKFITSLKLITIGHSLGGIESLIQQPATMMDLSSQSTIPVNLFRLSVGIEDIDDLMQDLSQALLSAFG